MKKLTKITKSNHKLSAGHTGEEIACQLLLSKGYQIIARNIRYKMGEIDIIAKEGEILCFIEVRSRSKASFLNPKASIDTRKQSKFIKASQRYLQQYYKIKRPRCRFDAVSVIGYGPLQQVELIKQAFSLPIQPARKRGSPWQAY